MENKTGYCVFLLSVHKRSTKSSSKWLWTSLLQISCCMARNAACWHLSMLGNRTFMIKQLIFTLTLWRGLNSTNVLDEGLRIGEIGRWMNSKVNSVKQGGYESKRGCKTWLAFNLSHTVPSWPLDIGGQVSRIGWDPIQITVSTYDMNSYFD
jgi:hypothetical protein